MLHSTRTAFFWIPNRTVFQVRERTCSGGKTSLIMRGRMFMLFSFPVIIFAVGSDLNTDFARPCETLQTDCRRLALNLTVLRISRLRNLKDTPALECFFSRLLLVFQFSQHINEKVMILKRNSVWFEEIQKLRNKKKAK